MRIRIFNKTKHALTIKKNISIAPKGSIVRDDLEYSDHIKRLERNGFIAVTIESNKSDNASISAVAGDSPKRARRGTKDVAEETATVPEENI